MTYIQKLTPENPSDHDIWIETTSEGYEHPPLYFFEGCMDGPKPL